MPKNIYRWDLVDQEMRLVLLLCLLHIVDSHTASTSDGRSEFFINVELNNIESVQNYIKNGGQINVQSADGKTALMRAAQENHGDMLKYLLSAGADINIKNKRGVSVIGILSWQKDMIAILLDDSHCSQKGCSAKPIITQENIDTYYDEERLEIANMLSDYVSKADGGIEEMEMSIEEMDVEARKIDHATNDWETKHMNNLKKKRKKKISSGK